MRLLKKFLRKQTQSQGIVAISFLTDGLAVAVSQYTDFQRPRLLHCEFIHLATAQQIPAQLEALSKNFNLENFDCHIVLTVGQYRSVSLERPAVPEEELQQALRWKMADLLDFPADRATLDHYTLPPSNRANTVDMLEAIASDSLVLDSLIQYCRAARLNLRVIDIQETVLRNLATLLPENQQGVAVLYLQKNSGHIIIQKQGAIYLNRKINQGYQELGSDAFGDAAQERSNLALDIQRSLDYVESHFGIPPISSLALLLIPTDIHGLLNLFNIDYGITARVVDLSAIIDGDIILDDNTQNLCAPVIGACLRHAVMME